MGQRLGFAPSDLAKINARYCNDQSVPQQPFPQQPFPQQPGPQQPGSPQPGPQQPFPQQPGPQGPVGPPSNANRQPFYPNPDYRQYPDYFGPGPNRPPPHGPFNRPPPFRPNRPPPLYPQYPNYGQGLGPRPYYDEYD